MRTILFVLLAGFLITSCGGNEKNANAAAKDSPSSQEEMDEPETPQEAIRQLRDQLSTDKDGNKIEITDFRELKALLPEKVSGMKRTSHTGEKTGMMGINFSTANATYEKGDQSIDIALVDAGGMGMLMTSMAAWSIVEMDRETDTGYERTTTINGNKAFEKYDNTTKSGSVAMIVNDRYILTIEGENISEKDLNGALDKVKVNKLK